MTTRTTSAHIEFSEIVKSYPTDDGGLFTALDGVSLAIGANEFFTLLGPSGCGKTTLLRVLAGFESPDAGTVILDGRDITQVAANRRPVNTVFQSYALFPHMTILENVGFGLRMLGRARRTWTNKATQMLEMVQLGAMAHRLPAQLSGGQQQRVALARALACEPEVLLLDEPLSALDLKLRKEMQLEMKRIQRESQTTFIFVTHDQSEAITMSDRIAVMSQGRLQQVGAPREIYEQPTNRFVADFIGETNFIETKGIDEAGNGVGTVGYVTQLGTLSATGRRLPGAVLAIRPERIEILGEDVASGPNRVQGTVTRLVFVGPSADLHLDCNGVPFRAHLAIRDHDMSRLHEGIRLTLGLPSEHLRVLTA